MPNNQSFILGLTESVLRSTHNLCFRAKIRKNVFAGKPPFYYIKVGCKGVYITGTCYPDGRLDLSRLGSFIALSMFVH